MGRVQRSDKPALRSDERKSLIELDARGFDALLASKEYAHLADFCKKRETLGRAAPPVEASWLRESDHPAAEELGRELRANCDHLVVLGMGSHLLAFQALMDCQPGSGARAIEESSLKIHRLGDGLDENRLVEMLGLCESRTARVGLIVLAYGSPPAQLSWLFRLLEQALETRYSEPELLRRIVLVSDASGRTLAERAYRQVVLHEQLRTPQLIFTPLSLVGLWLTGLEAGPFCEGVRSQLRASEKMDVSHPAGVYALVRHLMLRETGGRETFLALSASQQPLGQWWLSLMTPTALALTPDGCCPSGLCLPAGLHQPQSARGFDVSVEYREATTREATGDLHESCAALIKQTWSKRGGAGCFGLVVPRSDLFSLGALLAFLGSAAGASQAIVSERPDRQASS